MALNTINKYRLTMKQFKKKEDFTEIRDLMLNQLVKALKEEPSAQLFKFTMEIFDRAGIEILEKEKDKSNLLKIIQGANDSSDLENVLDKIKNS